MTPSLDKIKQSLWTRLTGPGGVDLGEDGLRRRRVDSYLDHWLSDQAGPDLREEQSRLEAQDRPAPEDDRTYLDAKYPDLEGEWDFYFRQAPELGLPPEDARRQARNLWSDLWSWRWQGEVRQAALENFYGLRSDLLTRLKTLEETEKRVKSLFGPRDLGWDLEKGEWQHRNLDKLWEAADQLAASKDLQKLARLLGRSRVGGVPREDGRRAEEAVFFEEGDPQPGRTEIHGLKRGAAFGELLPQELGLLACPETSDLFWSRMAEGSLLGWDYRTRQPRSIQEMSRAGGGNPVPGGPLVVCLDTSGSMRGKPEQVAKTLVLALVKELAKEGRALYLINYSLELKSLELTDLAASLGEFLDFLGFSFYGGTDLNPALLHALGLLSKEAWTDADVLVISDFSQPKLRPEIISRMKDLQRQQGHKYWCVSVSQKILKDNLNVFDGGWTYNLNPKRTLGIDSDQLKRLPS